MNKYLTVLILIMLVSACVKNTKETARRSVVTVENMFDMYNGIFITRFVRQGKGPNEFVGAKGIHPYFKDSLQMLKRIDNTINIFALEQARNEA